MSAIRVLKSGSDFNREDLENSCDVFKFLTFSKIAPYINAVDWISVEDKDTDIANALDKKSGVDFLIEHADGSFSSLAHRTNFSKFATFTISQQEKSKRLRDLKKGTTLYPEYTCQSICSGRDSPELINAAIIQTIELYEYIRDGQEGERKSEGKWYRAKNGDYWWDEKGEFFAISWYDIREQVESIKIETIDVTGDIIDRRHHDHLYESAEKRYDFFD